VQRSFSAYYERFKAFLNPVNAQHLQQLLHIAAALHKCLQQPQPPQQQHQQQQPGQPHHHSSTSSSSRVLAVNDLLFDLGLDNVNMFELARWVRDNKMAFKVGRWWGCGACAVAYKSSST
jgi:6-phosphogluconolactonase (cycloisomerase 2 family)